MRRDAEKTFGRIAAVCVFVYITFGAGSEIYLGFLRHEVKASLPFIALSAVIFIARVGYGWFSGATRTLYVDAYGAIVMTFLTILKLTL